MIQIALVSRMSDDHRARLAERFGDRIELLDFADDRDGLATRGAGVEVVFGNVRPAELPALEALRWVHATWTGIENLLYPEMVASGVIITNTRGQVALPMAEHGLAGLLYLARDLPAHLAADADHQWRRNDQPTLIEGSTALVLGAGAIGAKLIPILNALGVDVLGVNSDGRAVEGCAATYTMRTVGDALGEVDHVICLLPATDATRRSLDRAFFEALKPGATFVNLSRGSVVDHAALVEAIDSGKLRGAVLDVTDPEPLPAESPLYDHAKVLITGHRSFRPPPPSSAIAYEVFEHNLGCYLDGRIDNFQSRVDPRKGY